MTLFTGSGQLPRHHYVWFDRSFIYRDRTGFERAVWFGLTSKFGEMWGCNLLLECGAVYRNIPPHAIAFCEHPEPVWTPAQAQAWDCYGAQFSTIEYHYFNNVRAEIRNPKMMGLYLFTAIPLFDGYTRHPGQSKEFMFLALDNGRLAIKSTDMVLFHDKSFVEPFWPTGMKRQADVYSCEMDAPGSSSVTGK